MAAVERREPQELRWGLRRSSLVPCDSTGTHRSRIDITESHYHRRLEELAGAEQALSCRSS